MEPRVLRFESKITSSYGVKVEDVVFVIHFDTYFFPLTLLFSIISYHFLICMVNIFLGDDFPYFGSKNHFRIIFSNINKPAINH